MKAQFVAYRGPDFASDNYDDDRRIYHYRPPGKAEDVAIELQSISGLALLYLPGDVVKWMMGNVELTFTVQEWRALTKRTDSVIESGRHSAVAAGMQVEKAKAHEL